MREAQNMISRSYGLQQQLDRQQQREKELQSRYQEAKDKLELLARLPKETGKSE